VEARYRRILAGENPPRDAMPEAGPR